MKLSYKLYCLYSYYNQTTTQRQLYDFDINKYYIYIYIYIYMCVCVVLWFSLLKAYSIPHIIGDPRRTRSVPSDNQMTPHLIGYPNS